jgi:PadR family transcriptional regulator, regulatory protein PadR
MSAIAIYQQLSPRFQAPCGRRDRARATTKVTLTKTFEYRIPIFIMPKRIRSKIARGSAELAILALLAEQPLYGFEISKRIDERTGGILCFALASLYPMLYDLEKRGWVKGRWEANQNGRDRRYYCLTPSGRKELVPLRREWNFFFQALDRLAGVANA